MQRRGVVATHGPSSAHLPGHPNGGPEVPNGLAPRSLELAGSRMETIDTRRQENVRNG